MFSRIQPGSDLATPVHQKRRQVLCAGLLLALAGCKKEEPASNSGSVDLSHLALTGQFHLQDPEGDTRTLEDYRGKVVLAIFGYTQCPDVCPTSLVRAADIRRELGERGNRLQVLFITVDPERDTPEILRAYAAAFDPTFVALRGTDEQTAQAAKAYGVFYRKVPSGSSYTMDHSALHYVVDADGKLRFALQYETSAQDCARAIGTLL
jgi:protein SCO1